jgi:hypothetical protein
MNESNIVQKTIKDLKRLLPGAVIHKHNDLSTAGIPDISINYRMRTTWVEVKYVRAAETKSKFVKHFDKLQLASNILLSRHAPTFYLVAYETDAGTKAFLYQPDYLRNFLEQPNRLDLTMFVVTKFGRFHSYMAFSALESVVETLAKIARKEP